MIVINVLLASYKGQAYLPAQIDSIMQQQEVLLRLYISDDESATQCFNSLCNVLPSEYLQRLHLQDGPRQGVNANFLSLIQRQEVCAHDLYAFSDQDDVWLSGKLSRAQTHLNRGKMLPMLYMGRSTICGTQLKPLFLSKGMPREASFKNALLESAAGGNTMVFNAPTLSLLQTVTHPVHHDWLTYMIVSACGGKVVFDDTPNVLYRQHESNLSGSNRGLKAKLVRLKKILNNDFRCWAEDNIKALQPILDDMTAENRRVYEGFVRLHNMRGWHRCFSRLALFQKIGLYRQRRLEHYGFMLAAFLGKI